MTHVNNQKCLEILKHYGYKFIFGYKLIDEEAINDYEITFKGGVEI